MRSFKFMYKGELWEVSTFLSHAHNDVLDLHFFSAAHQL